MEVELLVSGRVRRNNYMGCPTLISTREITHPNFLQGANLKGDQCH